ncbi:hypothetical protein K432DRAFT_421950 [Lepidopterella palustris CBS 459.81]|uniref:SRR1-like domain-containing protein n=1 Tax=Lepidopterella palustris CBS 459.81 TaxID=1314670 RepID=A0A8E2EKN9_9PEZI|nr:hypothetical protein K432DRAFT_421950 [Lepidopterella palustris CBS 459.81]
MPLPSTGPRAHHVKRVQMPQEDGWTMVTHTSGRRSGLNQSKDFSHPQRIADFAEEVDQLRNRGLPRAEFDAEHKRLRKEWGYYVPTETKEGLTVTKLVEEYNQMKKRWDETHFAVELRLMILDKAPWNVGEAIAFGTGSFCIDSENRFRSLWQLVLFMHVIKYLSRDGSTIALYAQEPLFHELDEQFLRELNVSVLHGDAASYIKPTSFVYSPFMDWSILLPKILKDKDPMLYVGNRVYPDVKPFANADVMKKLNKKPPSTSIEDCNDIARKFRKHREGIKFPKFELHGTALEGIEMYRKSRPED